MDWSLGYHSNITEGHIDDLHVVGTIPKWLTGTLLRNGPAEFEMHGQKLNSWMDGFAKIHAVKFHNGKPLFYNRKFLQGENFLNFNKDGHLRYEEFGTNSDHPIRNKLLSLYKSHLTDNSTVNLYDIAGKTVALSETSHARIEFDHKSLETIDHYVFQDKIREHLATGHLQYISQEDAYYGYATTFGVESKHLIYRIDNKTAHREIVATVNRLLPSYMHSMVVSQNYLCLTENPVKINPLKVLVSTKTLSESLVFDKETQTKFTLIHKATGRKQEFLTKPFFMFHHVNMFEDGDTVVVDLIEHAGLSFIRAMDLKLLTHNHVKYNPGGKLVRYILNTMTGEVERKLLAKGRFELPIIPLELNGKPHRYVYMLNAHQPDAPYSEIVKYDYATNTMQSWSEEGCFPSEVAYILSPTPQSEDDGLILSFVLDVIKKESFVIVLDAMTMLEQARVLIPDVIPFGSHGFFKS